MNDTPELSSVSETPDELATLKAERDQLAEALRVERLKNSPRLTVRIRGEEYAFAPALMDPFNQLAFSLLSDHPQETFARFLSMTTPELKDVDGKNILLAMPPPEPVPVEAPKELIPNGH